MELLWQLIKSFWFILIISVGLGQELELENNNNETWNVIYASPLDTLDIAGFQFDVDGATINSAYGGSAEAAGFMMTTNSTTVIGLRSSGATIPPDIGDTLVVLDLTGTPTGLSNMEFTFKGCMDDGYQQWSPNFGIPACTYNPDAIVEGVCSYNDCLGECGGTADEDCSGTCRDLDDENWDFSCLDCNGIPDGEAYNNGCGCVGGNTGVSDPFNIGIDSSYLEIPLGSEDYGIPVNVSNVGPLYSFYMELDYNSTYIEVANSSEEHYVDINNNNFNDLVHYETIIDTSFDKRVIFNLIYSPETDCSQYTDDGETVCEENNGDCFWNLDTVKCEQNQFSTECDSIMNVIFEIKLNPIMVVNTTSIYIHNLILNEHPLDITEDYWHGPIIISNPQGCSDEEACNLGEEVCEYPGQTGTEYAGDCDCAGNVLDDCGVCGGDGPLEYHDCYGNCTAIQDCAGVCGGSAYIDNNCGEESCVGGNTGEECILNCAETLDDCTGDASYWDGTDCWNGSAYKDFCGNCIVGAEDIDCFRYSFNVYNSNGDIIEDDIVPELDIFYVSLYMYPQSPLQELPDSLEAIEVQLGFDTDILSFDACSINPTDLNIEGDLTGELLAADSYDEECPDSDTTFSFSLRANSNEFYQGDSANILFLQFSSLGNKGENTLINYNQIIINETHVMKEENYTSKMIYFGDALSINESLIPQSYILSQNYPNPFNPITYIHYSIPNYDFITIDIINISGQIIKTIVHSSHQPGNYEIMWDGTNSYGIPTPSGIYFYKMDADEFVSVKKLVLLK